MEGTPFPDAVYGIVPGRTGWLQVPLGSTASTTFIGEGGNNFSHGVKFSFETV
jgi:hypothetical protein